MDSNLQGLGSLRITPIGDDDDDERIEDEVLEDVDESHDDGVEEEEEEEDDEVVTLGFAEKPKNPRFLFRHFFPSKTGGVPAWLDPVNLPPESSRKCSFCGDPLQFVLQVYAPLSKESSFHRTLFVFMCPSMSCLLQDQHEQWKHGADKPRRSVKVFRCQLPRHNPFYSSNPPKHDATDVPSSPGAALCSWCGTWRGEKVCSSCRRARYCSEKHQALHWRSGHKADCHQMIISSQASLSTQSNGRGKSPFPVDKVACKTLWPEYEIRIEDECLFDTEVPEHNSSAQSLVPICDEKDEKFHSLSDKFEVDADQKKWASFQERIARAPSQVLRYCLDATKPLWPLTIGCPSKVDIPSCSYCNGPRHHEFQIMPQLLYYFGVRNDPVSLDWATVVIYTCLGSCEAGVSYKEEFAWVQLYPSAAVS